MKTPAFQFYPGDWLSSTDISLMTPAEEGGYIRLLCHAWQQPDCGLPDDNEALAVLSRLGDDFTARTAIRLRNKFVARDGRLFNERLLVEREKQEEWRRKSAEAGRRSGKSRTKKEPTFNQPSTNLQPTSKVGLILVPTKPEPNANQNPTLQSSVFSLQEEPLPLSEKELEDMWESHRCYKNGESLSHAIRIITTTDGFDIGKLRERHPEYCDYYEQNGWTKFGCLPFIGWVQAGMPYPPIRKSREPTKVKPFTSTPIEPMSDEFIAALRKADQDNAQARQTQQ